MQKQLKLLDFEPAYHQTAMLTTYISVKEGVVIYFVPKEFYGAFITEWLMYTVGAPQIHYTLNGVELTFTDFPTIVLEALVEYIEHKLILWYNLGTPTLKPI